MIANDRLDFAAISDYQCRISVHLCLKFGEHYFVPIGSALVGYN